MQELIVQAGQVRCHDVSLHEFVGVEITCGELTYNQAQLI